MDLDHFIFNSDFPIDKIVYFYQFEDTVPKRSSMADPAYHKDIICDGIKEPLLFFAISATSPDFSDAMPANGDSLVDFEKPVFEITADGANGCTIHINQQAQNYTSKATKFFMRVYGFARIGSVEKFQPTQRSSSRMLINTDYNYLPLVFGGELNTSIEGEGTKEVSVEQGYQELIGGNYEKVRIKYKKTRSIPIVKAWAESFGGITDRMPTDYNYGEIDPPNPVILIDNDFGYIEINLRNSVLSAMTEKLHVRVWVQ